MIEFVNFLMIQEKAFSYLASITKLLITVSISLYLEGQSILGKSEFSTVAGQLLGKSPESINEIF